MNICICDDSKSDILRLKHHLSSYTEQKLLDYSLIECHSSKELFQWMADNQIEPDIIFLDIYMQPISGMEAAKILRKRGCKSSIIFTTSSKEHGIESYEIEAEGYLVKPYTHEAFIRAMQRCSYRFTDSQKYINVISRRRSFKLRLGEMEYIEVNNHQCMIHTSKESISITETLKNLEQSFKDVPCFYTCGRSFILNLNAIAKFTEGDVLMKNGDRVPIPNTSKEQLYQAWRAYKDTHK